MTAETRNQILIKLNLKQSRFAFPYYIFGINLQGDKQVLV